MGNTVLYGITAAACVVALAAFMIPRLVKLAPGQIYLIMNLVLCMASIVAATCILGIVPITRSGVLWILGRGLVMIVVGLIAAVINSGPEKNASAFEIGAGVFSFGLWVAVASGATLVLFY